MEEEITRAASGSKTTTASKRKTSSASTSAGRKTSSSTAAKKKTSSSTAKKKTSSTSAKKKTTAATFKVSAAEKKLITNYRKCGSLQKQIIALVVEKMAGGLTKVEGIERMINDQSDLL